MYRISFEEAFEKDLIPNRVGVDEYFFDDIDSAMYNFSLYEHKLETQCKLYGGNYFIEMEFDKNTIIISYIHYED